MAKLTLTEIVGRLHEIQVEMARICAFFTCGFITKGEAIDDMSYLLDKQKLIIMAVDNA